ncbi:protein HESO1 isoform X2 [Macadamia integrifolia]|uniref:protein HESO1 isoform X2 n=1 Tax=Macadamia integrifolia TaxID=60698 RepID=UPI001C4F9EA9|nr:protein HESO1 isoform X2 [Macadamia integrifolia]
MLEVILKNILSAIKPSEEDSLTRLHVINEFRAVVESVESLRGATVEPFGSFVSHLYSKWSDLDIAVEVPSASSSEKKKWKLGLLKDIRRALQRRGDAYNLQLIANARVPVLIYQRNFNHQNISCDISINNLPGQIKSKFLLWITWIDDRFHDMVLLVKEWAKAQNINDPKTGTLNSYSLCLLVIFHFQTCVPAILPPLMEIYAGKIIDDFTGERVTAERRIQDTCAANIERFSSQSLRRVNRSSLSELFVTFFEKIEDPLEKPDNAARAVTMTQLIKISAAFEVTHRSLISVNHDKNSLIANLIRPHIRSKLIGRTSQENPSLRLGRDLGPQPATAAAVPSPIYNLFQRNPREVGPSFILPHNQLQRMPQEARPSIILPHNQFQRTPQEARPSSIAAQRTGQAANSRVRMMWKPRDVP